MLGTPHHLPQDECFHVECSRVSCRKRARREFPLVALPPWRRGDTNTCTSCGIKKRSPHPGGCFAQSILSKPLSHHLFPANAQGQCGLGTGLCVLPVLSLWANIETPAHFRSWRALAKGSWLGLAFHVSNRDVRVPLIWWL